MPQSFKIDNSFKFSQVFNLREIISIYFHVIKKNFKKIYLSEKFEIDSFLLSKCPW